MGTLLCAAGILLTSFNVFPLNIILGGIGSFLWVIAAAKVKDKPLLTIEAYACIVYVMGLVTWFFSPPPPQAVEKVCSPPPITQKGLKRDWDETDRIVIRPLDPL